MRYMTLYKLLSVIILFLVTLGMNAQSIDPSKQINWALGPIPQMQPALVNGVPQVASWAGSDACAKLNQSIKYAIANHIPLVDASGLVGTQACAGNPFDLTSLSLVRNSPIFITVKFGVTHFQTTAPWLLINSAVQLIGVGAWGTQVEYTGTSPAAAVLAIDGGSGTSPWDATGIHGVEVDGIYFYGDTISSTPNVTDGLLLTFVNRSKFDSVYAWGVSGCGIRTKGAVTDTFIRPRVAVADALVLGIQAGHPQPTNGLCLGGLSSAPGGPEDTTSGSVIDVGTEGVSNAGILIQSADQMSFIGGTSEQNAIGLLINTSASGVNAGTSNKFNSFQTIDLEGNGPNVSGDDITDNSSANMFQNILAASPCSSCQSVKLSSTGEDYYLMGISVTGVTGQANGINPAGANSTSGTGGSATALPAQPKGYMLQQFQGNTVAIPYY